MKLTHSPRRRVSDEKNAVAVRGRYGGAAQLSRAFSPRLQSYCDDNLTLAVGGSCPTLGLLIAAYGPEVVQALVACHITDLVSQMGEQTDMTPDDINATARSMCASQRLRLLTMASVAAFFNRMKCGEYPIYGRVSPRKLMEAANRYAEAAAERESKARDAMARQEHSAMLDRMEREGVTWAEYCAIRGIDKDTKSPLQP